MPASSLRAKPGDLVDQRRELALARARRAPSAVSAVTVALRGALSSRASSPKASPGPRVATLRPRRLTLAVPSRITKNSSPGRALAHERPCPARPGRPRPAGRPVELLPGEGGEERHLGEVVEEGVVARHGRESKPRCPTARVPRRPLARGIAARCEKVASDRLKVSSTAAAKTARTLEPLKTHHPEEPPMSKAVGIDLGTTNSVVSVLEAGEPAVIPNAEGAPHHPVGRRVLQDRRGARRRGREAPGDHQPGPHDPLGEAPHRHRLDDRHRRQGVQRAGDLGPHPAEAQARRRGVPRRHGHPGRRHRPRVLRRRRAPGHQGGRRDRGPRGPAHHQRADRGRARRTGSTRTTTITDPRLRPRRRHVRRVGARARRGRLRGQVDRRQHAPRRRRLGPARHRLDGRRVQERARRRPRRRQDGHAAPEGGGGEGQDRALARCRRRRSTCRSSPRRPTARCTSSSRSRARSSRSSPPTCSRRAAARSSRPSATPG